MTTSNSRIKTLALASLALGAVGILLPMIGALGSRIDLWSLGLALMMIPAGLVLALLGCLIGLFSLWKLRTLGERLVVAAHGIGLSLLVSLFLANTISKARLVPPIHDITTDTADPPVFTLAPSLRSEQENSLEYRGEVLAAMQLESYPQVRPLLLPVSASELHARVLEVLADMGMEVIRDDATNGEIEAVATTFWFGFKDDLIVRLRAVEGGTRMDLRSVSRIGTSDLGANAERILAVMERVKAAS